jgi:aspartate racemase
MRTIGIIGGSTWASTLEYYRLINQLVNKKMGGNHSARVIINSLDFQQIMEYNKTNDWESIENYLVELGKELESANVECILLGANTFHKIADKLAIRFQKPIISIVEETAKVISKDGIQRIGLLGTKYTMTGGFYQESLANFNIETMLPSESEMNVIHESIYSEFSKGIFTTEMKAIYIQIIDSLIEKGAEAIIMGCTEIPLLLDQKDVRIPLYDTTLIHAEAAVAFSLNL